MTENTNHLTRDQHDALTIAAGKHAVYVDDRHDLIEPNLQCVAFTAKSRDDLLKMCVEIWQSNDHDLFDLLTNLPHTVEETGRRGLWGVEVRSVYPTLFYENAGFEHDGPECDCPRMRNGSLPHDAECERRAWENDHMTPADAVHVLRDLGIADARLETTGGPGSGQPMVGTLPDGTGVILSFDGGNMTAANEPIKALFKHDQLFAGRYARATETELDLDFNDPIDFTDPASDVWSALEAVIPWIADANVMFAEGWAPLPVGYTIPKVYSVAPSADRRGEVLRTMLAMCGHSRKMRHGFVGDCDLPAKFVRPDPDNEFGREYACDTHARETVVSALVAPLTDETP